MKKLIILLIMLSFFKSNAQDFFLGDYKKPELLMKLEKYQAKGNSWEHLGFYIDFDHHYPVTPLDVIPFAATGGSGIHFGFLTDFGNEKNLENAPIVLVSPSNDPPVKLVANNLKDFLKIVMVIGQAEFLDEEYSSEEEIKTRLAEWDAISENDWQGNPLPKSKVKEANKKLKKTLIQRENLRKILINKMKITPMDSIVNYISQIRIKRAKDIKLKDFYNIGIKHSCDTSEIKEYNYEVKDISKIDSFLKTASLCEKILFYRNSTLGYILSDGFDEEIKFLIIESLENNGFKRESLILILKY
tara:strand:+ start:73 stop:978 length:906 start_codon:yes stop_codon:yes gene_type:complete